MKKKGYAFLASLLMSGAIQSNGEIPTSLNGALGSSKATTHNMKKSKVRAANKRARKSRKKNRGR